ncbi:hypothetical protein WDZ17_01060 [Pseudokineococcus basanitobsidens]|uniref:DUF4352 domain-containing protein n=1 Tax=Pseudokineococcus basanitobsidens TaxID=1926649 RepID=A0ABU8RFT3_9ACTN
MATTEVPTDEHVPPAPGRPRTARPWRRRAVVAGGVVALVVVGAGARLLVAQPLVADDGMTRVVVVDEAPASPGDFPDDVDLDRVTEVTTVYGTEYHVPVEDGSFLDVVVSVANDGPLPVTLTDVGTPLAAAPGPLGVLDGVDVAVPVDPTQAAWRSLGDGVVVEPGRSLPVRLVGRVATACGRPGAPPPYEAGSSAGTDQLLDLRYEVLGVPRRSSPTASWTLSLDGPFGCADAVS